MRNTATLNLDLGALRAELLKERDRISHTTDLHLLATHDNIAVDDQATVVHDQFLAMSGQGRRQETLRLIDAALRRVASGSYGQCEDCGREIPRKRLEAIPWAPRCVPCQEQFEANPEQDLLLIA